MQPRAYVGLVKKGTGFQLYRPTGDGMIGPKEFFGPVFPSAKLASRAAKLANQERDEAIAADVAEPVKE